MPPSTILEINTGRVASVRVAPNEDVLKRSIRRQLILVFRRALVRSGLERVWEICSSCFRCVIQALDVDRAESWPDGEDCQEDEALPI
jgi:hypothetical protein